MKNDQQTASPVNHRALMSDLGIELDELNPQYRKEVEMYEELEEGLSILNPEDPKDKRAIKKIRHLLGEADEEITNALLNLVDVVRGEEQEEFIQLTKQVHLPAGKKSHPDGAILDRLYKEGKVTKLTATFLKGQGITTPLRAKEIVFSQYKLVRTSYTRFHYKLLKK